ncbi:hypothetical protein KORDIASMS9_02149 [Kordia sp. SMS9]|nr:hypothetical protein KORDIASMS9_02149 [Kordia sp. SMS9]
MCWILNDNLDALSLLDLFKTLEFFETSLQGSMTRQSVSF